MHNRRMTRTPWKQAVAPLSLQMAYNSLDHNRTLHFLKALQAPVRRFVHTWHSLLVAIVHHSGERFSSGWFLSIQNDEKSTVPLPFASVWRDGVR
jgi:hypothetical protein